MESSIFSSASYQDTYPQWQIHDLPIIYFIIATHNSKVAITHHITYIYVSLQINMIAKHVVFRRY